MSNTGKILRKNLHPVIDKNNQEIVNLTEASADMFDSARTSINDSQDEINITTASGIWLDKSGIDLGDGRTTIDSDETYRPRLKGALLGRGVVRPRIENAVNSLLGDSECSIVKWDEAEGILPVYGFAVDLPVFDVEGFYLDDEGDDEEEDGAYLDISAYCCDWLDISNLWDIQKIINLVNSLKSSASTFQLWSGDYIYKLEVT